MNPSFRSRVYTFVSRLYLVYRGLLPALATFAILWAYGYPWMFFFFLIGTAGVGVYLAAVMSYTHIPESLPWLLLALLDGPIFVLISLRNDFHPLVFAIEGFVIEGGAIWMSILILAFISPLPTRGQRIASILFMAAILGMVSSFIWPYFQASLLKDWMKMTWLIAGITQATILNFREFKNGAVVRQESDGEILYIVGLLMVWLVAMIAGAALHEANLEPII
jgi:hypothetical protein